MPASPRTPGSEHLDPSDQRCHEQEMGLSGRGKAVFLAVLHGFQCRGAVSHGIKPRSPISSVFVHKSPEFQSLKMVFFYPAIRIAAHTR